MNPSSPKPLIVAGLMSGTSADGIDIAVCRITPGADSPKLKLLHHSSFPYPKRLRETVLAAMDAKSISVADLSRLHWHLGKVYADSLEATLSQTKFKPNLIALHGQTIYHQATAAPFLGAPTRTTWQIGEPSIIAERLRLPVVSDFRPADLAAAGQGAPLVPMLDYAIFRHAKKNRILLNLGGIANMTAIPAAAPSRAVLAFDSGPANMVIDAIMQRLKNQRFDKGGSCGRRGQILQPLLQQFLANPYFKKPAPKSCGREEFGERYVDNFLKSCGNVGDASAEDAVATATELTADSILRAYADFIWPHLGQHAPAAATELIAAGGGTHNATLMRRLTGGFAQYGIPVTTTAALGLPVEAKEAAAFALLGWLTWHHLPGNIPSATGAHHPAILGKVTYA